LFWDTTLSTSSTLLKLIPLRGVSSLLMIFQSIINRFRTLPSFSMHLTWLRSLSLRVLTPLLAALVSMVLLSLPAQADALEAYVLRYLDAKEPVSLAVNDQGQSRLFSAVELSEGKRLFEENCKNCHVGGATLPDPTVPLSLQALEGAMPPRDNISSLVSYLRQPMTYDGSEETYWCRQVSENWMSQEKVENLSAFILRSAQKAPGWGITSF
jgi:photosystem II cytochrome c550